MKYEIGDRVKPTARYKAVQAPGSLYIGVLGVVHKIGKHHVSVFFDQPKESINFLPIELEKIIS